MHNPVEGLRQQILVLLSALLWSTSFPVIKIALRYAAPLELATYRFFFAALFANVYLLLKKGKRVADMKFSPIFLILGLTNALGFYLQFQGQLYTSASKTALIVNLYIVFAAIIAYFLLKEKLNRNRFVSLALALTGMVAITTHFDLSTLKSGSLRGDLLVLGASLVWSLFIVLTKIASGRMSGSQASAMLMNLTFLFLLIPFLFTGSIQHLPSSRTLFYTLYLGLFASFIPYSLYITALKKLEILSSSILLVIEIALAVLWSWLFLGETLTLVDLFGGILIGTAILLQGKSLGDGKKSPSST